MLMCVEKITSISVTVLIINSVNIRIKDSDNFECEPIQWLEDSIEILNYIIFFIDMNIHDWLERTVL